MAEYRVIALFYRLVSESPRDNFDNAIPMSVAIGEFTCELSDGILTALPSVDFRDRAVAKRALETHLRGWEQVARLSAIRARIRFEYERSDVEEVAPRPDRVTVFPETIEVHVSVPAPTIVFGHHRYPAVDSRYVCTPLTGQLTARLERTRDGGETWPAFANFVVTRLEVEFGGTRDRRRHAADALSVDVAVLRKPGEVAARPDPEIGRKAGPTAVRITALEQAWMEAVVVRLIRRVGEQAGGAPLELVTLADFPALA